MIIMQIPEALKATGRKVALDPMLRQLMTTDLADAQIAIASGVADLASLFTTYRAFQEFLDLGEIYLLPASTFDNTAVDTTNNTITLPGTALRVTVGDRVQFSLASGTGTIAAGLSLATDYWIKTFDLITRKITLSATSDLAATVDITSAGDAATTWTMQVQETADVPMQAKATRTVQFGTYLGDSFRYYYIQGTTLNVLPKYLAGRVAFAVPAYPATLDQLPNDRSIEQLFIETLAGIVEPKVALGTKAAN